MAKSYIRKCHFKYKTFTQLLWMTRNEYCRPLLLAVLWRKNK